MKNKGYLNLLLRDIISKNNEHEKDIQKIENPLKNSKMISQWIKDVEDIHNAKKSLSVFY